MGADKALLSLGTENLVQRALRAVAAVCPKPIIVGNPNRYGAFGEVIDDLVPGCGPLGGIHAALNASESDRNLILSVDMPLVTPEFLRWLMDESINGIELVTVPQPAGRSQPLCAIYRRGMLPVIEKAIAEGEYKVDRTFSRVPTRYLSDGEIRGAGFAGDIFANMNTPEEFDAIKRHIAEDGLVHSEASRR
jgi:molybdenum cofactor guanylyltransferase